MEAVTVGLDIGSSVIRAAEIVVSKSGRRTLQRYAQIGIPAGWVVDGEINNAPGVAAALKRLWAEGGFTTTDVVVGVAGPRVFVRQADVPRLSPDDLRSALKFDAQELVPLAMEDASFDFSLLGPDPTGPSRGGDGETSTQRILLVAAHRDVLRTHAATLKEAGLTPVVMDAAPLALMRAVPAPDGGPGGGPGLDVIVSIGAELTTVAVRDQGVPLFIRSLLVGGAKLTERIANSMHLEAGVAERLKRGEVPEATTQLTAARKAMTPEMRDLAEEIRATIDFFVAQTGDRQVGRLLITGGAAQTRGLSQAVAGQVTAPVVVIDPLSVFDVSAIGFAPSELARISAGGTTAIGLALWPTEAPLIRLSLLPEEVVEARKVRRRVTVAAAVAAGAAAVLALAGVYEILAVRSAQNQVRAARAQAATLQTQVQRLQVETAVHTKVAQRTQLVTQALGGDIDWTRVVGQLAGVMPADLSLQSLTAARTPAQAAGAHPAVAGDGSITFSVKGTGGLPAVSAWLQGLQSDPDLSDVQVSGINVKSNGGAVNFASTANLTRVAESHRTVGGNP
ncbi:MAG TPA: type IV pilus assembly protein PilM [Acidimicrobiales bacterium]|nr:type IV pilus assembly protein PilM [Acidimicrobiales bacterium]